jgi:endoglucanase
MPESPSAFPAPLRCGCCRAARTRLPASRLYVDPNSTAKREAEALRRSGDIGREVDAAVSTITGTGSLPVFVAYNIPGRDCCQYSAGGANGGDAYRRWMGAFAFGLRGRPALVVLEPDALAGMDCLNASGQQQRLALLREAVQVLKGQRANVYIDAGNARWKSAEIMADRLRQAGIAHADGCSLNVSSYIDSAANLAFGERLSRLLGGKHFIIKTSRNGLGSARDWCNARGQALGVAPTTRTGR